MRKAIPTLICFLLLVHAVVPALPAFVCAGMAGVRLLHPCCPPKPAQEENPQDAPAWKTRCCQPVQTVKLDAQRPPPARARILALSALPLSHPTVSSLPPPRSALFETLREARPPDQSPHLDRRILRI